MLVFIDRGAGYLLREVLSPRESERDDKARERYENAMQHERPVLQTESLCGFLALACISLTSSSFKPMALDTASITSNSEEFL